MLSASLEGLACELHIDIDRRLLAGAEARGKSDRAMRVYAELFLAWRLHEPAADPGHAELPLPPPAKPPPRSPELRPTSHHDPMRATSGHVDGPTLTALL